MDVGNSQHFTFLSEIESFDCADILERNPGAVSQVYTIYPHGESHSVFCDMDTDLGGWTVRIFLLSMLLVLSS